MTFRRNRAAGGKPIHPRGQAGFSLLELTVVTVMVVILSSISISAAQDQLRNEQTYATAQELVGWIANVQRAAKRAGCAVISPSLPMPAWWATAR